MDLAVIGSQVEEFCPQTLVYKKKSVSSPSPSLPIKLKEIQSETQKSCLCVRLLQKMKQKIVVKVEMHCGKCRSKAMKIAAVAEGVISVAIGGAEKDRVEVIGEGVDSATLTNCLRKKVGYATLLSVEEIKPKVDKKIDEKTPTPRTCCCQWTCSCQNPAFYIATMDYPDQRNCPIM